MITGESKGRRKTTILVATAAAICFGWLGFGLHFLFAPVRILPNSEFIQVETTKAAEIDSSIERSVRRAKLDYLIYPVDFRSPRKLVFKEAWLVEPNDWYLVFYLEKAPYDFLVFYRVSREDGRLLWKAGVDAH